MPRSRTKVEPMNEDGRKIVLGIIAAITCGVGVYILVYGLEPEYAVSRSVQADIHLRPVSSPEIAVVSRALIGTWKREGEAGQLRDFKENGIVLDRSNDTDSREGMWGVFTAEMAAEAVPGLIDGVVYIQMTEGTATRYYRIERISTTLDLVDLYTGARTVFSKVEKSL